MPMCCWGLLVPVEKLLGDLERAKLAVPSKDSVVLRWIEAVFLGWYEMHRCIGWSSRCSEMIEVWADMGS